jgi:hypothetical protein
MVNTQSALCANHEMMCINNYLLFLLKFIKDYKSTLNEIIINHKYIINISYIFYTYKSFQFIYSNNYNKK